MNFHKIIFLLLFFIFAGVVRVPIIFQMLPPQQFSDEETISKYSYDANYKLGLRDTYHLMSGGINFYIPALAGTLIEKIKGQQLNYREYTFWGRFATVVLLNSVGILLVLMSLLRLGASTPLLVISGFVLNLSPFLLGSQTMLYPDDYIFFFPCLLLYCMTFYKIASGGKYNTFNRVILLGAGFICGAAASVKFNAGLIVLFPLFLLIENFSTKKDLILKFIFIVTGSLLAFFIFNALDKPFQWVRLWHGFMFNLNHYRTGHAGLMSDYALFYYIKLIFFLTFGVFGSIFLFLGCKSWLTIPLLVRCLFLSAIPQIMLLGLYRVAIHRNLMIVLLPVLLIIIYGLHESYIRVTGRYPRKKKGLILFLAIFCIILSDPLWRFYHHVANSIQPFSKTEAQVWLNQNYSGKEGWGQSGYMVGSTTPDKWEIPADDFAEIPKSCFNYFVLDMWYLSTFGEGTEPLLHPLVSEFMFINPTRYVSKEIRVVENVNHLLKSYSLIKTFNDNNFYGPTVKIYKRNEPCTAGVYAKRQELGGLTISRGYGMNWGENEVR